MGDVANSLRAACPGCSSSGALGSALEWTERASRGSREWNPWNRNGPNLDSVFRLWRLQAPYSSLALLVFPVDKNLASRTNLGTGD